MKMKFVINVKSLLVCTDIHVTVLFKDISVFWTQFGHGPSIIFLAKRQPMFNTIKDFCPF